MRKRRRSCLNISVMHALYDAILIGSEIPLFHIDPGYNGKNSSMIHACRPTVLEGKSVLR